MKTHPRLWPRRERIFTTCLLMLTLVICSPAQDTQEKIDVDNVSRTYVVHLPRGYDQQQHYPVVILLHGRNQDADDMARLTHFNQVADKEWNHRGIPNATRGQWNMGVRTEQPSAPMQRAEVDGAEGGAAAGVGGPGGGGGYPGGGGGYPGGGQSGGENPEANRNRPEPPDDVAFLNQMLDATRPKVLSGYAPHLRDRSGRWRLHGVARGLQHGGSRRRHCRGGRGSAQNDDLPALASC
jgi:hypothetical protein